VTGRDELGELRAENASLREQLAAMMAEMQELRRRLGQNSSNSSRPPSSDPPQTPKRAKRQPSGRKPGGQPGHDGSHRQMVADPDATVEHPPERCEGCGGDLGDGEPVGEPVCHQVWELPAVVCLVTEHQRLRRRCACCKKVTLGDVAPGTPAGAFGPNLCATVVGLATHMSREEVAKFVTDNFACPMTAASVEAICKRASDALAGAYDQLAGAVGDQPVVHADETGWRWPGLRRWAWLASTEQIAVYHLTDSRAARVAKLLLGEDFNGVLVSDRYGGYGWIDPAQRQACWSHLLRDFQALADRGGRTAKLGRALKQTAGEVLAAHRAHQIDGRLVAWHEPELLDLHHRLMDLLEQGSRMRDPKTSRFCNGLLDLWPALWNFTETPGVDPTNNRAERALRFAVLLRKRSGGTRTDSGDRFIERLLTVRETCRLQGRNLHDYLLAAITAALHGQPAPSLMPAGP
jgi:transposase